MKIQLIRHATLLLLLGDKKILVDPVFSPKGVISPIPDVPNQEGNPLVELPFPVDLLINCDGIIVTHTHRDHFDGYAANLLPKETPVFCQPEDEEKIKEFGFRQVLPVHATLEWGEIKLYRTKGKHGHGITAKKMAPVSGFVISAPNEPGIYLMGDTVWCSWTEQVMSKYRPEIVISNCGEAKFSCGKAITMNREDILSICRTMPGVKVVAVHMEAWNHCRLSRSALRSFTVEHEIEQQVYIPADGELISL